MHGPTAEREGERTIREDPFSVIFARDVDVSPGHVTAFAGGITDRLASLEHLSKGGATGCGKVQIIDDPAGALIAVSVEVENDRAKFGTRHDAIRNSDNVIFRLGDEATAVVGGRSE